MVLKMKKWNKFHLDFFVIFLNISNSYSIIPYLLLQQDHRSYNTAIIFMLNLLYLALRFKNVSIYTRDSLFNIVVLINITNFIIGIASDTFGWGMLPFIFANTSFYFILFSCFKDYLKKFDFIESQFMLLRGYFWLCLINIISVVVVTGFIVILNGNVHINNIGANYDLFTSNLRDPRNSYYFPYWLSIVYETIDIRLPILQAKGLVTGFFHEPHTYTFLVIPSYFLIINFIKSSVGKISITLLYFTIILTQFSSTNIIGFTFCFLLMVYFEFFKFRVKFAVFLCVIVLTLLLFNFSKFEYFWNLLTLNPSGNYSLSMIKFAFTPESIFGTSFYDLGYLETYWQIADQTLDVGIVNFTINIVFLSIFIAKVFKLISSGNKSSRSVAYFSLYFLIHSMKITFYVYSLSYLIFVVFIMHHFESKIDGRERTYL